MFPCDIDLTPTPSHDAKMFTYEVELPTSRKKISFNTLDGEEFTFPYTIDTIPNSPARHKLPTQAKNNVWIIDIHGKEPIKEKGEIDETYFYQTQRGK